MRIGGLEVIANTVVVSTDAPLVTHSYWMATALSYAKDNGHAFVLITHDTSKLTRPLLRFLNLLGAMWVVDDGKGHLYLGGSGNMVTHQDGEFLVQDDLYQGYVIEGLGHGRGGVLVRAESLKPRRQSSGVGDLAAHVSLALTGQEPLGWGLLEPVSQPWSEKELTAKYSKDRSLWNFLHFVGPLTEHRLSGSLEIQRPRNGVVEHVEASVENDRPWSLEEKLDFAQRMHEAKVRWATAMQLVGADPTVIPPYFLGLPVPGVAVFGPEAIRRQELEALMSEVNGMGVEDCRLIGEKKQSLSVIFPAEPGPDGRHPSEILDVLTNRLAPEV